MDNPDQRSAVRFVLDVLRKITRAAKVLPFVYLAVFSLVLITDVFLPDSVYWLIHSLLYIPPSVIILSLSLSKLLKLCAWHKTACSIPLLSQAEGYIDSYVFQFTQGEIIFINTAIGLASLAFIVLAYRHFFYGREGTTV